MLEPWWRTEGASVSSNLTLSSIMAAILGMVAYLFLAFLIVSNVIIYISLVYQFIEYVLQKGELWL